MRKIEPKEGLNKRKSSILFEKMNGKYFACK